MYEPLSKKDLIHLFEIIDACVKCRTELDLNHVFEKLHQLILYADASITYVDLEGFLKGKGKTASLNLFNAGFPAEFIDIYLKDNYAKIDVPLKAYLKTSEVQIYSEAIKRYNNNIYNDFEMISKDFGYHDGWVYGVNDLFTKHSTIMCINCGQIEKDQRTRLIIKHLTSHLAEGHKRVLKLKEKEKCHLTKREVEVLNWLKEGKTSWEISMILKTSKRTIDFHTCNCIEKLDAANRTNAVAVALGKSLIKL